MLGNVRGRLRRNLNGSVPLTRPLRAGGGQPVAGGQSRAISGCDPFSRPWCDPITRSLTVTTGSGEELRWRLHQSAYDKAGIARLARTKLNDL